MVTYDHSSSVNILIFDDCFSALDTITEEKTLAQIKWQNYTKYPLILGWIYIRADGYKRAVIQNIKTKETKFHYILDKKDFRLLEELSSLKRAARRAA